MPRSAGETPATQWLRKRHIPFEPHPYDYVDHGGTHESARQLGVDEFSVIKTLILENDHREPMIVLMHGTREVSLKALAREIGVKAVRVCSPDTAQRHSGYLIGGTSPFGTRKEMPVYAEHSVFELARIYINGGRRGLLVSLSPADIEGALPCTRVKVGAPK
jgi:Cys-tRNA(Pro) deacylase